MSDSVEKQTTPNTQEYDVKKYDHPEVLSDLEQALRPVGRILEDPDYNVWGCSPVYGPDGRVHVFYSRWKNGYDHLGWVAACEVAHAVADTPEGPFETVGVVLQGRGGSHWDSWSIHNPTVQRVGDKYVMFYMGSDGSKLGKTLEEIMEMDGKEYDPYFHKLVCSKRVGMAIADDVNGPWRRVSDEGPIVDVGPEGAWDDLVVSNPAFLQHKDGRYWLYYKGWDYKTHVAFNGNRRYGVAIAENLEGPYTKHEGNPLIDFSPIDPQMQCEDGYFWCEGGKYQVILRDMGFFNHEYGLLMSSEDGVTWSNPEIAFKDAPSYFDEKLPGLDREGRFERPQMLLNSEGIPDYLFCAYRGGRYNTSSGVVLKIERTLQA